jgi:hypothetical protein
LLVCPSFTANLESVISWTSPKTGIDERIGDHASTRIAQELISP